ncbi:hypothetical protein CTE05_08700 [Cellulomonas terrae]|uniref:Uncharacterized protein n=1 Tax=Cellulomonas terrae TaxID=311234 RepID=A0A511JI48_9CELL|nr:hypothetical protein CTE05_08700 [Cellulomonas terrae]
MRPRAGSRHTQPLTEPHLRDLGESDMTGCCKENGTADQCCREESAEHDAAATPPKQAHTCAGHHVLESGAQP